MPYKDPEKKRQSLREWKRNHSKKALGIPYNRERLKLEEDYSFGGYDAVYGENEVVPRRVGGYYDDDKIEKDIEIVRTRMGEERLNMIIGLDEIVKKGQAVYKTPEQLAVAMVGYEDWCEAEGLPVCFPSLALYLRVSKRTIVNMAKEKGYRDVLEPVIDLMDLSNFIKGENAKNPSWAMFVARNNFGGVDKYEDKSTTVVEKPSPMSDLTDEELEKQLASLRLE